MVVNTHANGDHCYGNQLVADAQIIASVRTAEEMITGTSPAILAAVLDQAPALGQFGEFMSRIFGSFDFKNITLTPPNKTFAGELNLNVGNKVVQLLEVGPAHTMGDTMVYIPADKAIFTGDILFIGVHPIMWAGPISNWIRACDLILSLDVETIVPGHGPITDKKGVTEVKGYLEYVFREAQARYDAGMPAFDAARDIPLEQYASWTDSERIAATIASIYREFSGDSSPSNLANLFGPMAGLALQVGSERG
jgi:glyoxylase-like metal-dependent hydrolase (beta-lactamase superfamily II)